MGRDFANRVATRIKEQHWKEKSECMELNFWDCGTQWRNLAQMDCTMINGNWPFLLKCGMFSTQ